MDENDIFKNNGKQEEDDEQELEEGCQTLTKTTTLLMRRV